MMIGILDAGVVVAVGGTLGSGAVGGTLGSLAGSCMLVGGSDVLSAAVGGGLKREARWRRCFRVCVSMGGSSVEWDLESKAAVRSLAAAVTTSAGVADGILQWCGNQRTVCAILVRPVDGSHTLWQR